ncbi:chromosome partitioning protein ParA [Azotobacter salinestris]|uniref:chromosome partitioning protein ParA n=1 Tax=Azotobacter salinestris TaxID=69964 RepID=UPI003D7F85D7
MVEAVMFFNEQGICREMLLPEFEAVLDGVVGLPDLADQQVRLAYLLISPRLEVRAAVFFYLDFDEDGAADPGWNLPLRQLSERAAPGIDLGAGPIRLVSRSRCPAAWHRMHLWDPELQDLMSLRDAAKRNQLGLLCEEEGAPAVGRSSSGLQVANGHGAAGTVPNKDWSDGQRQKTARLIKRQRLHIRNLNRYLEEAQGRLKQAAELQARTLQAEVQELHEQLNRYQALNASLEAQLQAQSESRARAEAELAARAEQERLGREEILRLRSGHEQLAAQNIEQALEGLASLGLTFVVYHPGAGHLTIPLQEIARYQESPIAYAAAKCSVSEEQYRQWLRHFQQPVCECELTGGKRCALPIDRVDNPQRFVAGESNCCARHKSGNRLRNAG